jgi:hypothetical protein
MDVQMPSLQQVSQQVGGARAVQHIRGRGVLGLWMDEQVDRHLLGLNSHHFHLRLNSKGYGSHNSKEPQTRLRPLGHYTLNEARVVWEWSEMVA